MKKIKFKKDIISTLKEICDIRSNTPISTHIATALMDYPSIEGISDKELYFILEKYKCTLELDMSIQHEEDIDDIIASGINLDSILDDEDDY